MKCPRCDRPLSLQVDLEEDLRALKCPDCEGCWIDSANYWAWRESEGADAPPGGGGGVVEVPGVEGRPGKTCPECRAILIPSRVGHGHDFRIDRCGLCGGFWFDRNEWEALRSTGLHREIHEMATRVWQRNVREADTRKVMRRMYEERFSGETLEKLDEVHRWVHGHSQKDELLSYLLDDDPYRL